MTYFIQLPYDRLYQVRKEKNKQHTTIIIKLLCTTTLTTVRQSHDFENYGTIKRLNQFSALSFQFISIKYI